MTVTSAKARPIVVTDAYSPTNVGDSELVRLSVEVVRRRHQGQPVVVLAADPEAFETSGVWHREVSFVGKPLNRLTWKALSGAGKWIWLTRQAAGLALIVALTYLPLGTRTRRRLAMAVARIPGDRSLTDLVAASRVVGVGGGYLGSRYVVTSAITLAQFRIARRLGADVETMPLSIASTDGKLDRLLRWWGRGVQWRARDETTLNILHAVGLDAALVPDLAWLDAELDRPDVQRSGVTVAPVGSAFYGALGGDPKAWPAVSAALEWLPDSEPVRLVAMHRWDPRLEDGRDDEACAALAKKIQAAYPDRTVEVLEARSYSDVRAAMMSSRVAIAERLHAALAALTTATPCQVISYEPKHAGVLRLADLEALTTMDAEQAEHAFGSERLDELGRGQAARVRAAVGLPEPLEAP